MASRWKISSTYVGGEVLYQVYRILDPGCIDHSGNREVIGTFDTEEHAKEFCDAQNSLEGNV